MLGMPPENAPTHFLGVLVVKLTPENIGLKDIFSKLGMTVVHQTERTSGTWYMVNLPSDTNLTEEEWITKLHEEYNIHAELDPIFYPM